MASVFDVAKGVLDASGPVSTMKLEKLVYYCQVLSLVERGQVMFPERVEAWVNGPVSPALFKAHARRYVVTPSDFESIGDSSKLSKADQEIVRTVVEKLGMLSGEDLRELSHAEAPWKDARGDAAPSERCNGEIEPSAISSYYPDPSNPLFA
ncbi:Uncharacterized phage-associated protein [Parafannyhessea umbonata]|uniref:Uncharacterized phage-associated protein n=2 Tax=Parafannyhessea umbonata TaxID=604330 RepID=A0A1H9NHI7_9ACTN|nr:Uncharacterized phage-associated protein [Parafannyhessea umbonata]